jgi:hypothetical protein
MQTAFDACLSFVASDDRGGLVCEIERQSARLRTWLRLDGLNREYEYRQRHCPGILLHVAVSHGSVECVKALLALKASPNTQSHCETGISGLTALHLAVVGRHAELVQVLVATKARVDLQDSEGKTALHIAAGSNDVDCVRELLRSDSANLDLLDKKRRTALQYAIDKRSTHAADALERFSEIHRMPWANPANSPHVQQCLLNPGYDVKRNTDFTRILQDDTPRMPYRRRTDEVKTVLHWGQRKLLMSEIEFLTLFATSGATVVYAGAAPGTHIGFLSDMFPEVHFHLVDPAPFTVQPTDKITIVQSLFTDAMASDLAATHNDILFISDIRSADWERNTDAEVEERVKADMDMQQQWHLTMKPRRSMLKFRLPWAEGCTSYLDGDLYLPVWGPITTTETRLITKEFTTTQIPYDHRKYEEQLFYFNTVMRPSLYFHDFEGEGIDHCYDCRAEIHILTAYLASEHGTPVAQNDIRPKFSALTRSVSRQIARDRRLCDPNLDPADRKRKIQHAQWINDRPAYELDLYQSSAAASHTKRPRF